MNRSETAKEVLKRRRQRWYLKTIFFAVYEGLNLKVIAKSEVKRESSSRII